FVGGLHFQADRACARSAEARQVPIEIYRVGAGGRARLAHHLAVDQQLGRVDLARRDAGRPIDAGRHFYAGRVELIDPAGIELGQPLDGAAWAGLEDLYLRRRDVYLVAAAHAHRGRVGGVDGDFALARGAGLAAIGDHVVAALGGDGLVHLA